MFYCFITILSTIFCNSLICKSFVIEIFYFQTVPGTKHHRFIFILTFYAMPSFFRHQKDSGRQSIYAAHLSTAVAWREKKFKHFVFYKYFSLVLGLLKSRISEKINQALLRKPDFKLFHYKTRVQPVSKITTIATRNRCYM